MRNNVARTRNNVAPDAQQRCAASLRGGTLGADARAKGGAVLHLGVSARHPLTPCLVRPIPCRYNVEGRKTFDFAAVGGTGVLESTSDLYRRER
jgi:hypothetical protein